jgi:hypothetical protein
MGVVHRVGEGIGELPSGCSGRFEQIGRNLHLEFDGEDTEPIQVPDTGSWQPLQVITKECLHLNEGTQTMKIVMHSQGPSQSVADYLKFEKRVTSEAET